MLEAQLNAKLFHQNSKKLFQAVNKPVMIILGKSNTIKGFGLNSALFHFLLGYEFPETIIIIKEQPVVITSSKKASVIEQIDQLKIVVKDKEDKNLDEILRSLQDTYGIIDQKNMTDEFSEKVIGALSTVDVTNEVVNLLNHKDQDEVSTICKAGVATGELLKKGINMIRDHSFDKEDLLNRLEGKGFDKSFIEYSFEPEHDEGFLRLGLRYKGYAVEVARPFMTDLSEEYDIQAKMMELVRPGKNSMEVLTALREYSASKGYTHNIQLYGAGLISMIPSFEAGFTLENNMCFCLRISFRFSNTFVLNETPAFVVKKDVKEEYSESRMRFRNKSNDVALAARIKEHQKELLEKLVERQIVHYRSTSVQSAESVEGDEKVRKYEKDSDIPRSNKVVLDWDNMYVIVPLLSYSIPFHVSMIKNVALSHASEGSKLRINFKEVRASNEAERNDYDSFMKSICVSVPESESVLKEINDMKREFNKPTVKTIAVQTLQTKSRPVVLADLYMRTDNRTVSKKACEDLEVHENGMRYGETVIPFSNIKNAFFQEGTGEERAIFHLNLKEPMTIGKPTMNVQFFKKLNFAYHDTNKRENEYFGELQEEEDAAEMARINDDFQTFITRVEHETKIRVQAPERGFLAVHSKESVYVSVTNECLVSINEQPFFVLNLDDVEIVNLERITFITKTFDAVFVFKNKARPTVMLNSIDTTKLMMFKEFLDDHGIVFMETKMNINWGNLMQTIMKDPLGFYESGGWGEMLREDREEESEVVESSENSETEDSTVGSTTEEDEDDESSYTEEEDSEAESDSSDDTMERKSRRKR